ncbi:MAG: hypothetical protein WA843_02025 [Candidatus Saccharimonadales bacterium]
MAEVRYFNQQSAWMHENGMVLRQSSPPPLPTAGERHLLAVPTPEIDPRLQGLAENMAMHQKLVDCSWFEQTGGLPTGNQLLSRQLEGQGITGALDQLLLERQEELRVESDFTSDEIDQAFEMAWQMCREVTAQVLGKSSNGNSVE